MKSDFHHTGNTAQRTITDTTLPTGPIERTITYLAPFTKPNREQNYEQVWSRLDEISPNPPPTQKLASSE